MSVRLIGYRSASARIAKSDKPVRFIYTILNVGSDTFYIGFNELRLLNNLNLNIKL